MLILGLHLLDGCMFLEVAQRSYNRLNILTLKFGNMTVPLMGVLELLMSAHLESESSRILELERHLENV